ncbi:hypothetical protein CLOP_g16992, partial [Closterium sp. NIES-67]
LYRGSTIGTDDCHLFLAAATTPSPFNHTFTALSPSEPLPFPSSSPFSPSSSLPSFSASPSSPTPKIAFLFLSRGPLPLAPLWKRFFRGYARYYSAYIHPAPGFRVKRGVRQSLNLTVVPSKPVFWGTLSIVEAIKRLLAHALLDAHNVRFMVVSERDIPLHAFPTVYRYLLSSPLSFSGGHRKYFRSVPAAVRAFPRALVRSGWVHGECWLEMARPHAWAVVSEWRWHEMGLHYCLALSQPTCCVDENLMQNLLTWAFPHQVANRTVMSVLWKGKTGHPHTYLGGDITAASIRAIKEERYMARVGGNRSSGAAEGGGREGGALSGLSAVSNSSSSAISMPNSSTPIGAVGILISNNTSTLTATTTPFPSSTGQPCTVSGHPAPCWLFARKFVARSLPDLLALPEDVLGY